MIWCTLTKYSKKHIVKFLKGKYWFDKVFPMGTICGLPLQGMIQYQTVKIPKRSKRCETCYRLDLMQQLAE